MFLFYPVKIEGDYAIFSEEEARHCLHVLRKRVGEPITFVDGRGGWYEGLIDEAGKRHLTAKIQSKKLEVGKRGFRLHIAVAPTKNIDRFEWFLEKATELGIDEITPLICEHSERTKIRPDRLEKVLLSAMKQSLRAYLPKLNELTRFDKFLKLDNANLSGTRFIAHCRDENLPHLFGNCKPGIDVTILVGPEGDFSLPEIEMANRHGFQNTGLGKARLRTETAAIAACHIINLINE